MTRDTATRVARAAISVAFAFAFGFTEATTLTAQDRPDPSPPRHVVGVPATVPLLMLGNAPAQLPVVEVFLDGKGPFRFGIETGANFLTIRPSLGDSLGLKRTRGTDSASVFMLDSLRIGAARFDQIRLVSLRTSSRDIDGVLGLPLSANLLLTIDYPSRVVRFEEGALPAPNGRDILPLTRTADFWSLPLSLGDKTFQGVIDTRSTGALGVVPVVSKTLDFDGEPIVIGRAVGAAIAETEVKSGRLKGDARIGQYRFPSPDIGIRALPPGFPDEPLVGTVLLQQFTVTLDQKHARVRLSRPGSTTIELPRRAPRPPPAAVSPANLAGLAGHYGDRDVTFDVNTLYVQRPGGPRLALVPTGNDTFTLQEAPAARFEFARDASGKGTRVRVLNRDGQWETVDRSPP